MVAFLFRVFQVTIENPAWRTVRNLSKYDLFSLICNLQIFRYELTTNRRETVVHLSFQTNVQHHFDLDFRYAELIYKITQYDILLSDDTPFKIHRYCRQ